MLEFVGKSVATVTREQAKDLFKRIIQTAPKNMEWFDRALYTDDCYIYVSKIYDNLTTVFQKTSLDESDIRSLVEEHGEEALTFLQDMQNEICLLVYNQCHVGVPTIDKNHAHLMGGLYRWRKISDQSSVIEDEGDPQSIKLGDVWFKVVQDNIDTESVQCRELKVRYKHITDGFQKALERDHGVVIQSLPKFLTACDPKNGMSEEVYDLCEQCIDARIDYLKACIKPSPHKTMLHRDLYEIADTISDARRYMRKMRRR